VGGPGGGGNGNGNRRRLAVAGKSTFLSNGAQMNEDKAEIDYEEMSIFLCPNCRCWGYRSIYSPNCTDCANKERGFYGPRCEDETE